MTLHVSPNALALAFVRFSAWLDSRKPWEQNLIVGALLVVISALFTTACHLAGLN
jgi:hypothetical protein